MERLVVYFGFNVTKPPGHVPVVDVRGIRNPYGLPEVKKALAVINDPGFEPAVRNGVAHLNRSGVVFIGCGYGKDRSRIVAQEVSRRASVRAVHISEWLESTKGVKS